MAHKDASKRDRSYKGSPDLSLSSVYSTEPDVVGFSVWTAQQADHPILFTLDDHATNLNLYLLPTCGSDNLCHQVTKTVLFIYMWC